METRKQRRVWVEETHLVPGGPRATLHTLGFTSALAHKLGKSQISKSCAAVATSITLRAGKQLCTNTELTYFLCAETNSLYDFRNVFLVGCYALCGEPYFSKGEVAIHMIQVISTNTALNCSSFSERLGRTLSSLRLPVENHLPPENILAELTFYYYYFF